MAAKRIKKIDRKINFLVGVIFALVFVATGVFITFRVYPDKIQEKKRISEIPLVDMVHFNALERGGQCALSGRLAGNDPLESGGWLPTGLRAGRWSLMTEKLKEAGFWRKKDGRY